MGKASRRKRERRGEQQARTLFGSALSMSRRADRNYPNLNHGPDGSTIYDAILYYIPQARTIVIPAEQAHVAHEAAYQDNMAEMIQGTKPPFSVTLIDFVGVERRMDDDVPWKDTMPAGVLIFQESEEEMAYITFYYRGNDLLVLGIFVMHLEDYFRNSWSGMFDSSFEERPAGDNTDYETIGEEFAYAGTNGARRAATSLLLLESANVDLVESPYPRGHVSAGAPRYEVVVRQSTKRYKAREGGQHMEFTHRFEVRGNFAHHFELTAEGKTNRIYERWSEERPEKIVEVDGRPCVRIWRPPYVIES